MAGRFARGGTRPARQEAASGRSIRARLRTLATVRVLVPARVSSRPVPSSSPPIRVRLLSGLGLGPLQGPVTRRLRGAQGKALGLRSRWAPQLSPAAQGARLSRPSSATVGRAAAVDWALERLPTQPVGTSAR